jgi:glycosyltransferase involved in cell wall biosynthesis
VTETGYSSVAWITDVPSGDQIDLLKALASRVEVDLTVIYCSADTTKGSINVVDPYGRGRVLKGTKFSIPRGNIFLNPSIVANLLKESYDLVVVGGYFHPTMQLAMLLRALQRKPWVMFAERPGMNMRSHWANFMRKFAMLPVRSADAIIATGRLAKASYEASFGPSTRVFSLPYLIDSQPFQNIERKNGYTGRSIAFMACGQLIPRKGIDVLIRAFQRAARSRNIVLSIVGDGPERDELAASVAAEFRERIRFIGFVPFADRLKFFAESDVFVHPARHDGWGVVIQEAMSAGLPVVATVQTGAAYELVEEGQNGFLVETEDEVALSDRIGWFADHAEQIPAFGARARTSVARLTPEWGASELVRIAQIVLANRP